MLKLLSFITSVLAVTPALALDCREEIKDDPFHGQFLEVATPKEFGDMVMEQMLSVYMPEFKVVDSKETYYPSQKYYPVLRTILPTLHHIYGYTAGFGIRGKFYNARLHDKSTNKTFNVECSVEKDYGIPSSGGCASLVFSGCVTNLESTDVKSVIESTRVRSVTY